MPNTKIKFCGVMRPEDAELAVSLDAWAIGMIMWPHSPRSVSLDQAAELGALLKRRAEVVGVFVNPTLAELDIAAETAGLTLIQLHGQEGPSFCAETARRTGCRVIKAARVRDSSDIQAIGPYHTDFHLLDSHVADVPGGSGESFNWDLALQHRRLAPPKGKGLPVPLILSGGLTPEKVAGAIAAVQPYAVDVASGVETAPGIKDEHRMRAFAAAVAEADRIREEARQAQEAQMQPQAPEQAHAAEQEHAA
jgi:phosphoribosylanthranilate isomerase